MMTPELQAQILRLYRSEKWPVHTIARQVGVHHGTVKRVLWQAGHPEVVGSPRPRLVDPYLPFIRETLARYPGLCASRVYQMVKERGYRGGPDHFRAVVACERPRPPAEAFLRLQTLPGEQGQVDWGHFGHVQIGAGQRALSGFVMVLSHSRHLYLEFFYGQKQSAFLWGHQGAFDFFGGVPRVVLYDNLKSAVLERQGEAIRFHPQMLRFAAHYGYEVRPVAVARGNQKGRVERAIQYIRTAFFAARTFRDVQDLNEQARAFCLGLAAQRKCPADKTLTVAQAFEQEQRHLLPLPDVPYAEEECVEVHVGKTPYVRFDKNDYSVPHDRVRRTLVVRASRNTVRILEGTQVLAQHARSYDQGRQVEEAAHIQALLEHKQQAQMHRGVSYLSLMVPQTKELLVQLAQRGGPLASATAALLRLLAHYGQAEMQLAVAEALSHAVPHPNAVRHVLERRCRERQQPPPLPVGLPPDSRLHRIAVVPHDLATYDALTQEDLDVDKIF